MKGFFALILYIACVIAVWVIYHKMFTVVYFRLGDGCFMELFACSFLGIILFGLIVYFWYIALIVAGVLAYLYYKRNK